jgi:hypothetical protein
MYSAGRIARLEQGESELFDNLTLVGVGGRFCGILTERQLTLQDFEGYGIRIKLSTISTLSNINIAKLPVGCLTMGVIGVWVGIQVLAPPLGFAFAVLGAASTLSYLTMKTPVLVIETNVGDRHLVSGSQSVLLRLCMMVDRVMHGSSIKEAKAGLAELEEMKRRMLEPEPTALLGAPDSIATPGMDLFQPTERPSALSSFNPVSSTAAVVSAGTQTVHSEANGGIFASLEAIEPPSYTIPPPVRRENEPIDNRSAYERAWGRPESPDWYQEKEVRPREDRIDEVFSDAVESFDLFGEGGIFDAEPAYPAASSPTPTSSSLSVSPPYGSSTHDSPSYDSPSTDVNIFPADSFADGTRSGNLSATTDLDRRRSSSQMIRSAQFQHGAELARNSWGLPTPTEEAVREECRPGLVKQARAQQVWIGDTDIAQQPAAALTDDRFGEDFPAISRLANSMGSGRVRSTGGNPAKQNWLESLLTPISNRRSVREPAYAAEYGDPDGENEGHDRRFRSSQLLRLRSDQDHQADVASRVRNMSTSAPSSARDALDSVVNRISRGEGNPAHLLPGQADLRFSHLRSTGSKGDAHLPGIRRLE